MSREQLMARFLAVRACSEQLMAPLLPDEFRAQPMPDVSPPYWNLGHTSWFFATNLLRPHGVTIEGFEGFDYVFNSYYEGLGPRLPRAQRGSLGTPATEHVWQYRRTVDAAMLELLAGCAEARLPELAMLLTIGIEHEQQHQELLVTEILNIRNAAPAALRTAYVRTPPRRKVTAGDEPLRAQCFTGGLTTLGHQGDGFCWDNELPAHPAHVPDFALGTRLISNREWCAFVDDGGYRRPLLWLSNGWLQTQQRDWQAPLYWERHDGRWHRFTLHGLSELDPAAPVCHVSFYEADAFARWYGEQFRDWKHARLPRESEWEHAARTSGFCERSANLLENDLAQCQFDVRPAGASGMQQLCGDAWEWTQSHYEPYPGYRPFAGALTEYNGKFMDNQRVLRGGSFATPRTQARLAYRNFWPPETRFQATSLRLLRDA